MEKRINIGGEFYMADFGYFSMSVYKFIHIFLHITVALRSEALKEVH